MNFEEWADKVTDGMIRETFKHIKTKSKDPRYADHALSIFLAKFVGNMVYKRLAEPVAGTKQQQYDAKHAEYLEVKTRVLEAVAAGFSGAMKEFSGKTIDYHCVLRDVSKAMNKEPC